MDTRLVGGMKMIIKEPRSEAERQAFTEHLPRSLVPLMAPSDGGRIVLGAWGGEEVMGRLAAIASTNEPDAYMLLFLLGTRSPGPGPPSLEVEDALLAELESRVRLLGYRRLVMQPGFRMATDQAEPLLGAMHRQGWQEIRFVSTRFHIQGYRVSQERWFEMPLPDRYSFFFWRDLKPEDRKYLNSRMSEAGPLDPLGILDFEPETSLGLRDSTTGQVAGWFVNERAGPVTIRLSKLFLFPEARSHACFYPLIAQACRHAWPRFTRAVMAVNADNPRMRIVLNKVIGHLCFQIVDCYYCEKRLHPVGP